MIDTQHIQPEDLSLHAMRLLPVEEARAVQAHILQCDECRREFMDAQADVAAVALTVELHTPRPQAKDRFLMQVARERRAIPIDRADHSERIDRIDRGVALDERAEPEAVPVKKPRTMGTLLPWVGWALAAGVSFFAVSEYHQRGVLQNTLAAQSAQLNAETVRAVTLTADAEKARLLMETLTDTTAMRVTLNTTPAAKPAPQGRANYLAQKGTLVFIASNMEPLPLEKVYELWIIPKDGGSPVPAGTFSPDARGNASVVLPDIPKGIEAKAFGVTMEAEGGALKPSLPILMMGA